MIPLQLTNQCNMESSIGNNISTHEFIGQICVDQALSVLRIQTLTYNAESLLCATPSSQLKL